MAAQTAANPDDAGGSTLTRSATGSQFQLRVTSDANQGARKYMEDEFCIAGQPTASGDRGDLHYSYLAVFDGHGGGEASAYARDHLFRHVVNEEGFRSEVDSVVLGAIKNGFLSAHHAMWEQVGNWPTNHGLPSTAGTTASVVFLRRNKLFIGHVGDSGIVLGYQDDPNGGVWKARKLTTDHVPDNPEEFARIMSSGGKVGTGPRGGCPRIIFDRPAPGHVLNSEGGVPMISIPFLSMSRALGDFWSYNSQHRKFVVSPEPDTFVVELDDSFRCLILGTDGLWNMVTPEQAVDRVYSAHLVNSGQPHENAGIGLGGKEIDCSKMLVDAALAGWRSRGFPSDNITAVTAINIPDLVTSPPTPPEPVAPIIDLAPATNIAESAAPPATSGRSVALSPPLPLSMEDIRSQVPNGVPTPTQGRQCQGAESVSIPAPEKATATSGSGINGVGRTRKRSQFPGNRKRRLNQVGSTVAPAEGSANRKSSRLARPSPSLKLQESTECLGTAPTPSSNNDGPEPKKARISDLTLLDSPNKTK